MVVTLKVTRVSSTIFHVDATIPRAVRVRIGTVMTRSDAHRLLDGASEAYRSLGALIVLDCSEG